MPKRSSGHPNSLANLRRGGGRLGVLNHATRDLKRILDRRFFSRRDYWRGLAKRINAGEAPQQECLIIQLRYGRPKPVDEDDLPFTPAAPGATGPQLIFNIPRPPAEMTGRVTVVGAVRVETTP